jgi:hypothetical protein
MKHTITQPQKFHTNYRVFRILLAVMLLSSGVVFNACDEEESGPPNDAAPTITSFSPESGLAGTEVTINGTNFDKVISILFNGVKATPKSKTATQIKVDVPAGATSGNIKLTYGAGNTQSSKGFSVTFKQVSVSDFEEDNITSVWNVAEDAGEISKSEFLVEGTNHYFHLKGADNNHNFWIGGRYKGTGNPATYLGVAEKDPAKVFFNVDVKNNEVGSGKIAQAKLVLFVHDVDAPDDKRNWEIDFPVNWSNWKTISIAVDDFHRWNNDIPGFEDFYGDISTVSEVALYITGYGADNIPGGGPDFSFDNVILSEGAALGTIIQP